MELVQTRREIIRNAVKFDSYKGSPLEVDNTFYKDRIRLGNIFIYLNVENKDMFCPSRFAGYKNNDRQKHEAFSQKHGTHTTQKIDTILGNHNMKTELESRYKKHCKDLGVTPANKKRRYWSLFIKKDDIKDYISLTSKNYPDELPQSPFYAEGASKQVLVNAYERNEKARKTCIDHYGCKCIVCGFDFYNKYGDIGHAFIHVHHLKPLSMMKTEYQLNPITDLRPVCPNCHAMLHKNELSIDKLKDIIKKNLT